VELRNVTPTLKGPASTFTGDVYVTPIHSGQEPSRMTVALVRFAPGAHTNWHRHAVGQTLHVTDGVGLVQSQGDKVTGIRTGDVVYTPPGEWHWHGAAPDHFMVHTAIWEAPASDAEPESDWGEHVTDQEYSAG